MSKNHSEATVPAMPADQQLHDLVVHIGQCLSLTTNERQHSLFTNFLQPGILHLDKSESHPWFARRADLLTLITRVRSYLFGNQPLPHHTKTSNIALAPIATTQSTPSVGDDFWDTFEPGDNPLQSWTLLTGQMQRLYVELVSRLMLSEDHRPALARMLAMDTAVLACETAIQDKKRQRVSFTASHDYRVMEIWEHDNSNNEHLKQIRAFLAAHLSDARTVSVTADTDPVTFTIRGKNVPTLVFNPKNYLAVDQVTGELVAFPAKKIESTTRIPDFSARDAGSVIKPATKGAAKSSTQTTKSSKS